LFSLSWPFNFSFIPLKLRMENSFIQLGNISIFGAHFDTALYCWSDLAELDSSDWGEGPSSIWLMTKYSFFM
jgi:hypothetical protein